MHFRDVCTKRCTVTTIGFILFAIGLGCTIFWTSLFNDVLAKEMAVRPNSRSYDVWKTPPLPMSIDIYFFNWTNPEDFLNKSTKPILQELGPYRFTEKSDKVDIEWHPDNGTVSFKKKSNFFFDEKGSKGRLTDKITTLNIIALSAAATAKYWKFAKKQSVSIGLQVYDQKISVTKSANELLFEGYSDDMIDMARSASLFGVDVHVPFDRFGWFYTRNGSADLTGHYNMFTGEKDIRKIGKMNTWNSKNYTEYFKSYCGMVNGSAGEFYPPKQNENGTISMFSPDLCRTINLDFNEKITIEGIEGYKYIGGPKTVDNGTNYPENECFCNGECVPSGVMNISACRFGTPVFMSFPHYLHADKYFINQVEGVKPVKDKHEFYITLEPTTGIVLEVAARFQINMLITPLSDIALYENVPYLFMPVLWFEQKVTINKEMAADLQIVLSIPTTGHICAGILIVVGLIMLLWFPLVRLCHKHDSTVEISKTDKELKDIEKIPEGSPLINAKLKNVVFLGTNQESKAPIEK